MKFRGGYKYQTAERFETYVTSAPPGGETIVTSYLTLTGHAKLTIFEGYAWDGVSGPAMDTDDSMVPGLVHDALYQLLREGHLDPSYRAEADRAFYEQCLRAGMNGMRAKYMYWAVDKFAAFAASPENRKEVREVPD